VRHEEETGARGDLFPQKPICRTQQTGSRDESRWNFLSYPHAKALVPRYNFDCTN